MATRQPTVPLGDEPADAAMQQPPWRKSARLSSAADVAEAQLARAGFDRGPWLAVAFASGIAAWFVLADSAEWVLATSAYLFLAVGALALWRGNASRQGDLEANTRLASQRAKAVESYLVSHGVDKDRIRAIGVEPSGERTMVETANGIARVDRASASLALGPIQRPDLTVFIAGGEGTNVIGMNFLSTLSRWSVEGRTLVLRP